MNTNKKLLAMGIILMIAGITAALLSFSPSMIVRYVFVVSSLAVGILGLLIGKKHRRSIYTI